MNLLLYDLPTSVLDVNGTLYFDIDDLADGDFNYSGEIHEYQLVTDYRNVINIMLMYETAQLSDGEKAYLMLRMLFDDNFPDDIPQAYAMAMQFLECGDVEDRFSQKNDNKYGRLYSWEQDGNYIYAAMNFSHNDVLKNNSDLHWWEFVNKFLQLSDGCLFNHIIANRLAFKMNKMTDDQKTERKEHPEIYVLKEQQQEMNIHIEEIKRMEALLNNRGE